jgi:aspartyl-tRNA(Asn)/glutamyl-tRNA(Gln) amidotransferase subunit A
MVLLSFALINTNSAFDNYFLQAQKVRKRVRADFNSVFRTPDPLSTLSSEKYPRDGVDVLIHPSAICTAPLLSDPDLTGLQSYVQDMLTVPASLAGLPALSVPAGLAQDGWPVGISIVGQWGFDEMVLKVGDIVEQCNTVIAK